MKICFWLMILSPSGTMKIGFKENQTFRDHVIFHRHAQTALECQSECSALLSRGKTSCACALWKNWNLTWQKSNSFFVALCFQL